MFLIHVTIPIAEGDWDICFRVDFFFLSIASGFPEDFSDRSRYRPVSQGNYGIFIEQNKVSTAVSEVPHQSSKVKHLPFTVEECLAKTFKGVFKLFGLFYCKWLILVQHFCFHFFPQLEQYFYWFFGLHMDSIGGLFTVIIRTAWYCILLGKNSSVFRGLLFDVM